jgi:peptidoglycan hydrolase-like protein with peptidoglycan-binding domain
MDPIKLNLGDFGEKVAQLHENLKQRGLQISPEEEKRSFFGPSTSAAVRTLQNEHKLPVTGVVDHVTHVALQAGVSTHTGALVTAKERSAFQPSLAEAEVIGPARSGYTGFRGFPDVVE